MSTNSEATTSLLSNDPYGSNNYEPLNEEVHLTGEDEHDEVVTAFENDVAVLETSAPPKDAAHLVSIALFIIGLACFFPSTAVLSSNSYYEDLWGSKGKGLVFIAPIMIQVSTPFVQSLVAKFQERITYTARIETAFICNTIIAVFLPIQAKVFPSGLSFILTLLCILGIGVANSVLKATLLSLTAQYPPHYTQILLVGQAASPMAVLAVKALLKYLTPHSENPADQKTTQFFALVFFIVSACVTGTAALFYKIARKTIFSKHFFPSFKQRFAKYQETKRLHREYKERLALEANNQSLLVTDVTSINSEVVPNDAADHPTTLPKHDVLESQMTNLPLKIRKLEVLSKMMYWGILLALSCIPPNAVYPALLNSMEPHYEWSKWMSGDWFHLFMLFVYCTTDILSRAIPLSIIQLLPLKRLPLIIMVRYGVYLLTVVAVYLRHPYVSSWVIILLTIITASSQAVTYVAILTQYQQVLNLSVGEKSVSGTLSAIFIAIGVLGGYVLSLLMNTAITGIWGKAH